jgi:glycosyltransferase involved in cell wall biosynthesis
MARAPRVSIIIPFYNVERYLPLTLDSVLAQTMDDFELILCDDGSKDESVRVARSYAAQDARIRVLEPTTNGGAAAARNRGFAASNPGSEFVIFFDSDDVWAPEALSVLVQALEASPDSPAAHCVCHCIDPNGDQYPGDVLVEHMRNRRAVEGDRIVPVPCTAPTTFEALLVANYMTTPGTTLVRRTAITAIGEYESEVVPCEDWDMNLRIARLGEIIFVDRVLLSWRRHPQATSLVSNRWRKAFVATRKRTFESPSNTPAQRAAARFAMRNDVLEEQRQALEVLRRGSLPRGAKHLAKSLLFMWVYSRALLPLQP